MAVKSLLACAALLSLAGCAATGPLEKTAYAPGTPVSSIRARGVVELKKDSFSARGRAAVIAQAPGSFRIEVFGPFGQTAALFASDGERLLVRSEGTTSLFFWGDPAIPYSFNAREAVSSLTGAPVAEETGGLSMFDGNGRLSEYTREVQGRAPLRVTLDEYTLVDGAAIPFRISFEDGRRVITIKYTEVEVNPPFENGFFKVEAQSEQGAKEVD